jgi:hypothetical protein
VNEHKDRVDDAMHATPAAVEEGILPGSGVRKRDRAVPMLAITAAAFQLKACPTAVDLTQHQGAGYLRRSIPRWLMSVLVDLDEVLLVGNRRAECFLVQDDSEKALGPRS